MPQDVISLLLDCLLSNLKTKHQTSLFIVEEWSLLGCILLNFKTVLMCSWKDITELQDVSLYFFLSILYGKCNFPIVILLGKSDKFLANQFIGLWKSACSPFHPRMEHINKLSYELFSTNSVAFCSVNMII